MSPTRYLAVIFSFLSLVFFIPVPKSFALGGKNTIAHDTLIVKPGFHNHQLTKEWTTALITRMSKERIDSFARLKRDLSPQEESWLELIRSKARNWNRFRDSLRVPFGDIKIDDTIYVMTGCFGDDDGFTFGSGTVCLDLTALQKAYGNAALEENFRRIDRLFAHEFTHLLHKSWFKQHRYSPVTFRDSIWWECLYEGIGMYRSLNEKWLPVNGEFPKNTLNVMDKLVPIFVDRLITFETKLNLSEAEKEELHMNLSRGMVNQKWGAFPVAIWMVMEARGNDENLREILSLGPAGIITLAKKYLPEEYKARFKAVFP